MYNKLKEKGFIMSKIPQFTISELLEAGVHFGHKTMRWNPKMAPYIYGSRNSVHIIDLQQTAPLLHRALKAIHEVISNNGRVLFVGTKRQASDVIAEAAQRCGQYYVNHRWLGGMLTNWNTISSSIKVLQNLEETLGNPESGLTKKEQLMLGRQKEKLDRALGGIRDMGGQPDILFVVDTNKENIAIKEAQKLNIPVVGIVDSNSDPDGIDFPIPGNDDAIRAIETYCRLVTETVLSGIEVGLAKSGTDIGDQIHAPKEAAAAKAKNKPKAKPTPTAAPAKKADTVVVETKEEALKKTAKAADKETSTQPAKKAPVEKKSEPKAAEKKEEAKAAPAKKEPAKAEKADDTKKAAEEKKAE